MSKIEAINSANTYNTNQRSDKKAALTGAGIALGTGAVIDTVNLSYKAHQFVQQNKENKPDVSFKEGFKNVWNAFTEHGNATVKDGVVESKPYTVFEKPLKGKYLIAAATVLTAGLGAAAGVFVNRKKSADKV